MKRLGITKIFFAKCLILIGFSVVVAFCVNFFRPAPLDWIAKEEYEIFSDCMDTEQKAETFNVETIIASPGKYLLVDARSEEEYKKNHGDSFSLPYDPLFPIPDDKIKELSSIRRGRIIVVIGDGNSQKFLAQDLLEQGLKNVRYLPGKDDLEKLLPKQEEI